MKIKINNCYQKKIFNLCLPLYRSILFQRIKFETENTTEENELIKALNIKKRKERITYIYDRVYEKIEEQTKNINPCNFKKSKCEIQRKIKKGKHGCCRKCYYRTEKGCKTQNLTCKMFYCAKIREKYNLPNWNDFEILKVLTLRQRILLKSEYFSLKEDVLTDLYIGSLIIGTGRIIYRLIRNSLREKKSKS